MRSSGGSMRSSQRSARRYSQRACDSLHGAGHEGQAARDGLEIDIVLEQDAGDVLELAGVLSQHRVFELHDIDALRDRSGDGSAMPNPGCEIREPREARSTQQLRRSHGPDHIFGGRANAIQLFVRGALVGKIEEHNQVQFAQARQLMHRLIHEHAAAMDGRANGVRCNEQHAQGRPRRVKRAEGVAEMAAQRPAQSFGVGNRRKPERA